MNYILEYKDEKEFEKLKRSLEKLSYYEKNSAYKKLIFEYYPALREGNILGNLISTDEKSGGKTYELKLPTNQMFQKIYGEIKLIYTVKEKKKTILLDRIEPVDILMENHQTELCTYKGTILSKKNEDKDRLKITLIDLLSKD